MNEDNRFDQEPQFEEPDLVENEKKETEQPEPFVPRYDYDYHYNHSPEPEEEPPKNKSGVGKVFAIIGIVIGGIVLTGMVFFAMARIHTAQQIAGYESEDKNEDKDIEKTEIKTNSGSTVQSDVADVAESVMPSVVSITNMSIQEVQNFFFGGVTEYESTSNGSGIIVGKNAKELLIVSNYHVVEGSTELTVTFIDETSVKAYIKGTDGDMDLAIIAIPVSELQDDTLEAIKVATLGDSDALRVGEPTIAIGNALGYGQSVTTGIVSALHRRIENYEGELIQTDAAINPGNSGGALLNANGEVIGINTAKVSADAVEGMGYAIPISDVTDVINDLMNKETKTKVPDAEQGVIGIEGVAVDEQSAYYYDMPEGIYIKSVVEGGGAEKAGLQPKSIITEIDGTDVDTMEELQEQLQYYRAGESVELTIEVPYGTDYKTEKIEVTLGKKDNKNS